MNQNCVWLAIAVIGFGLSGRQEANAQSVAYGDTYRGTSTLVKYAAVSEIFCSLPGACSEDFSVTLESGYNVGEALMTGWYAYFTPAGAYPADAVRIEVQRLTYNSTTGVMNWRVTGELSESSSTATGFSFGVYVTLILADTTGTRLARKNSLCEGDTVSVCSESNSFSSSGATGIPFRHMAIRGFDIRSTGGQAMNLERIMVDSSNYVASGTSAVGDTDCALLGSVNQTMECNIYHIAIASANGHLTYDPVTWGPTWGVSPVYEYNFTSPPSGWDGVFLGLQAFDLNRPYGTVQSSSLSAGCFAPKYPSLITGHTSDIEWQWRGDFGDQTSTPYNDPFDVTNICVEGLVF